MRESCRCGHPVMSSRTAFSCVKCAMPCCSACAFRLDAATYCARCAESMLDTEGVPLTLSVPAGARSASSREARLQPMPPASFGSDGAHWLILVARDQDDLYGHLVRAFSRDDKVQIMIDRRKDYARNPPGMEERLRTHGAAVIRRRS